MKWGARTPRPSERRASGVYSRRALSGKEVALASIVLSRLGIRTLIVF